MNSCCNCTILINADPNANKFVQQGYGEYEYPSNLSHQPQRPFQPQQQRQQPSLQSGTRVIPIQVESTFAPQNNENNTIVMQR